MPLSIKPDELLNAFLQGSDLNLDIPEWAELLATGKPFTIEFDQPVSFSLKSGDGKPAQVATIANVPLSLGGSSGAAVSLDLVWPLEGAVANQPSQDRGPLQPFLEAGLLSNKTPAVGQLYVGLVVKAQASVAASAAGPVGGFAKLDLGLNAAGDCEFSRVKRYDATKPARAIAADFFQTLRWPYAAPDEAALRDAGEAVSLSYRGKLRLSAGVSLGYELSGVIGTTVADFKPQIAYQLKSALSLNYACTIGGAFRFALAAAERDGWVRVQVSRENAVGRQFGVGLDLVGDIKVSGLPERTDELLKGLIGLDVSHAFELLESIRDLPDYETAVRKLQERFTQLATKEIEGFVQPLLGELFNSSEYVAFKTKVAAVLDARTKLKGQALDLLERHAGQLEELRGKLANVLSIDSSDKLQSISDDSTWQFIVENFGDHVFNGLTSTPDFKHFHAVVQKVDDLIAGADAKTVADFLTEVEDRTGVTALVDKLALATDPTHLTTLITEKERALAARLFEIPFDKLGSAARLKKTFERVKDTAKKVVDLRTKLDAVLKKAREQKFSLSLAAEFARSSESTALLDLEFNVTSDKGKELLATALRGDFEPALTDFHPTLVHVHNGVLRRVESSSATLRFATFGWLFESVSKLSQLAQVDIREDASGLIYLFNTDTSLIQQKKSGRAGDLEELKTNLTLHIAATARGAGTVPADAVLQAVNDMSVGYTVAQTDENTSWDEVESYLGFAEDLGLLGNTPLADFLDQLRTDFPDGPGAVALNYTVKQGPTALLQVFHPATGNPPAETDVEGWARDALRTYFKRRYVHRHADARNRVVIDHYVNAARIDEVGGGRVAQTKAVVKRTDRPNERFEIGLPLAIHVLDWWREEREFLAALKKLGRVVANAGSKMPNYDKVAKDLVKVTVPRIKFLPGSELWRDNIFFLALDGLTRRAGIADRHAMMTLRIKPPGATESIVRVLAA